MMAPSRRKSLEEAIDCDDDSGGKEDVVPSDGDITLDMADSSECYSAGNDGEVINVGVNTFTMMSDSAGSDNGICEMDPSDFKLPSTSDDQDDDAEPDNTISTVGHDQETTEVEMIPTYKDTQGTPRSPGTSPFGGKSQRGRQRKRFKSPQSRRALPWHTVGVVGKMDVDLENTIAAMDPSEKLEKDNLGKCANIPLNYTFGGESQLPPMEMTSEVDTSTFSTRPSNVNRFTFNSFELQNAAGEHGHHNPSFTERVCALLENQAAFKNASQSLFTPQIHLATGSPLLRPQDRHGAISVDDLNTSRPKVTPTDFVSMTSSSKRLKTSAVLHDSDSPTSIASGLQGLVSRRAVDIVAAALKCAKVISVLKLGPVGIHSITRNTTHPDESKAHAAETYAQEALDGFTQKLASINDIAKRLKAACTGAIPGTAARKVLYALVKMAKSRRRVQGSTLYWQQYSNDQSSLLKAKIAKLERIKTRIQMLEQRHANMDSQSGTIAALHMATNSLAAAIDSTGIRVVPMILEDFQKAAVVVSFNVPMCMRTWASTAQTRHSTEELLQDCEHAFHVATSTNTIEGPPLYCHDMDLVIYIKSFGSIGNGIQSSCRPLVLAYPLASDSSWPEHKTPSKKSGHCFASDLVPSNQNNASPIDQVLNAQAIAAAASMDGEIGSIATNTPPNKRLASIASHSRVKISKLDWDHQVDATDLKVSFAGGCVGGMHATGSTMAWHQFKHALATATKYQLEAVLPNALGSWTLLDALVALVNKGSILASKIRIILKQLKQWIQVTSYTKLEHCDAESARLKCQVHVQDSCFWVHLTINIKQLVSDYNTTSIFTSLAASSTITVYPVGSKQKDVMPVDVATDAESLHDAILSACIA